MENYTYLLINFFTIIICFIYSFDKRIKFSRYFLTFLISCTIVAIPFILWDAWFTKIGIWWFNDTYLIGLRILGLPLEELLFFYCIPFSCIFTYYCLTRFFNLNWANGFNNIICFVTIIVCVVVGLLNFDKTYTLVTAILTTLTIIYLHLITRTPWIGQASLIYSILMLGFFPVNGILTGTGLENPIVNYNPNEFLNFRIGTIPIEDAVYGYSLFLWNIYFFKFFKNKMK
ncbi:lycopene cyclase domain-containing protein [Faecalibacter bovis]|uniref:Lycopene cyclase domain-containing protein n=1 Tax=Faecalibacter bovis TaxID=2898187 RepID=A0ABX7XBM7_9FLAO|nr:lycopene cyclase domain-containing protein [Faecalibacter bovis]